MFQNVGHRPRIQQRVRLSATPEGRLTSLRQEYVNHTSILDDYEELQRANMEGDVERFLIALEADGILPEDF